MSGGGPSRTLFIPQVPFDAKLEADTLEHLCLQEAGAHVRSITDNPFNGKRRAIFINFFSSDACERAKRVLEREYPKVTFLFGKEEKMPNDQVVFELLRPMHPDMNREHLKRFIKEYGFTLVRMEPSVQSAHKWLLTFDDTRDVDFVLSRMNGQRYDGGEVNVCRVRR